MFVYYNPNLFIDHFQIIVEILQLLHLSDFKNAVQICKRWYNVSCCSTVGRRIRIHFKGDINRSHKYIKRPFNKLQLTEVNLSRWNYKEFLKKFTFSIRELYVVRCTITFNKLMKCLKYLPNLETLLVELHRDTKLLVIDDYFTNLTIPLCNMRVLYIKCATRQIAGLNYVLGKCYHLKELTYCITNSVNSNDKSKIIANMCNAITQWPIVDLTSITIKINGVDMTPFFRNFRRIDRVSVKKLNLLDTSGLYDWIEFNKFCKRFPDLEELEMRSADDLDLMSICESFRNLRLLCLFGFSGRQLGVIGGFQNLEVLDVIAFNFNQDQLFHLTTSFMPNLKIFKLTRIKISREVLQLLCANFNNLLKLQLYLATDDCSSIFKYQQKLKILEIYFWETSPESPDDISTEYTCLDLTELRSLNITKHVPGLTEELISKMKSLKSFNFIDNFDVDDVRNFKYENQRRILNELKNDLRDTKC